MMIPINKPTDQLGRPGMMTKSALLSMLVSGVVACSSGGGGNLPPPGNLVPSSTAYGDSAVEIFESPTTQKYVTASGGGEVNDLAIRYDTETNQYLVQFNGYLVPDYAWYPLIDDPRSQPLEGQPNMNFVVRGLSDTQFMIRATYKYLDATVQYQYSNLAAWNAFGLVSHTAFGVATPPADIPTSGNGTYEGFIEGISSAPATGWNNEIVDAYVDGTVRLRFEFASGALTGEMRPVVYTDELLDLGSIPLSGMIASGPYRPYSGQFDTPVAGDNHFLGWFTGPAAEELIGGWTLPFVNPADGGTYSATGAWIAKKQDEAP